MSNDYISTCYNIVSGMVTDCNFSYALRAVRIISSLFAIRANAYSIYCLPIFNGVYSPLTIDSM